MVTNEELNNTISQIRKAVCRVKTIESLLKAAEKEYEAGGMEKGIYFATKGIIGGLKTYLKAAKEEETRLFVEYTNLIGEASSVMAVENYRASLKERKATKKLGSVTVGDPVKAVLGKAQPVGKRSYRNGTK